MNKKVIYTAIFNNYDSLKTPLVVSKGWDYLCFTNSKELRSDVWKIKYVPMNASASMCARNIKINYFNYVSKYDISVWVDASIEIGCNVSNFISCKIKDVDISLMQHGDRMDILLTMDL